MSYPDVHLPRNVTACRNSTGHKESDWRHLEEYNFLASPPELSGGAQKGCDRYVYVAVPVAARRRRIIQQQLLALPECL